MIRALAHRGNRPVVLLGLTKINMDRLALDHPILVNLHHLLPGTSTTDLPDIDVVIFFDDGNTGAELIKRTAARYVQTESSERSNPA